MKDKLHLHLQLSEAPQIVTRQVPGADPDAAPREVPIVRGYAAVFNQTADLFFWRERIEPGAFRRSLQERPDVRALWNHDSNYPIGRTKNQTLSLREDDHGLLVEIQPPDTSAGRDVVENIRSGLVSGMSIGFVPRTMEWELEDGEDVAVLRDVELWEVSPVTFPAYEGTEAALRSLTGKADRFVRPEALRQERAELVARAADSIKRRIAWCEKLA